MGGRGHHRRIAVPVLADDARVAEFADDHHHLGVVAIDEKRMDEDIAEATRQALVVILADYLAMEENDPVLKQCLAHANDNRRIKFAAEIDA